MLIVGDVQSMVFENEDDGPFYTPPILQQIWKRDEVGDKKKTLKKDLCDELDQIGISTKGKMLIEVQVIATSETYQLQLKKMILPNVGLESKKVSNRSCGSKVCWILRFSMLPKLKKMTQTWQGR
jgi:hypothetical protein